jgi:hypothetical protein
MPKSTAPRNDDLPTPDDDVEGHNLWLNPSTSREMTSGRSRDIDREAKERQRAKEAKGDRR